MHAGQVTNEKTELVPPLKRLCTPGVVRVSKLFTKKDVEAWKLNAFPFLPPHFTARQPYVCLERGASDENMELGDSTDVYSGIAYR